MVSFHSSFLLMSTFFSFRLDVHHMGSVNALWRHAYTPSLLERGDVERAGAGARGGELRKG